MYTERVIEHFRKPHNMGKLEDYSAIGKVGNIVCGDVMWLYIKVESDARGRDVIRDISWETFGCTAAIATSSMVSALSSFSFFSAGACFRERSIIRLSRRLNRRCISS